MRIIYDAYGQMCNRLWEYLDQIAWAKIHNSKVVSLFWDPSLDDFDNLRKNKYIKFPFYLKFINRGIKGRIYRHILYRVLHNKIIQGIFASPRFHHRGFVSGKSVLYEHDYYPEVWEEIKFIFSPNKSIISRIDKEFASFRNSSNANIVGVHIRRGDYKEYCDGRFYFSDEEYIFFMQQVCNLFGDNISFFISSNELIDNDFFRGFRLVNCRNTKPAEDLYCLSKCDYIIGPYSSFSSWASFYGNVPYCRLDRDMNLSIENFKIVDSFKSANN